MVTMDHFLIFKTVLIIDTMRKEDILVISWVTYYCLLINYEVNKFNVFC